MLNILVGAVDGVSKFFWRINRQRSTTFDCFNQIRNITNVRTREYRYFCIKLTKENFTYPVFSFIIY